jgi:hypothetical protein
LKLRFAEQLTALLLFAIPQFWRVARTITEGRFNKVCSAQSFVSDETRKNTHDAYQRSPAR